MTTQRPARGSHRSARKLGLSASGGRGRQSRAGRLRGELPQAIVTDLMMPGMTGLEFVGALGERAQQVAVVFVTGQAAIDTAVQAIKLGAYDYLPKPLEPQRFREVLEKGLKQIALARETGALRQRLESPLGSYGALIGKSAPMRKLYQQIGQIAATNAAVLVSGESGTGKELVARTLHDLSPRRDGEFSRPQLRGDLADIDGKRAVRSREGRLYQRRRPSSRLFRTSRRRHAVPRRNHRDGAGNSAKIFARARGRADPPHRRQQEYCRFGAAWSRPPTASRSLR